MNIFYGALVFIGLILLGQKNAKIALSLAGLILLGTILMNVKNFQSIMNGGFANERK